MYSQKVYRILIKHFRNYATKNKIKMEVSQEVVKDVEEGVFKPRKHPGVFIPRTINLPPELVAATEKALADYPVKQLLTDSKVLSNYLKSRRAPMEHQELVNKQQEVERHVLLQKANIDAISSEELQILREKMKGKVTKVLKTKVFMWKPMEYNIHTALQYLLGRAAPEYAVLYRIFQEIKSRDKEFKPRSFFDFGSGIGTAMWAVKNFWPKDIFEYFNVDSSADMNDLSLILLKGGTGVKESNISGVYYRQFFPATNVTYDIVVSAFSLLELPSSHSRLEAILKLWNKTQNYFVIVEQGTNAGFKIVNEARDFIIQLQGNSEKTVFSPCSHELLCPRFLTDKVPCNFEISYTTIPIGQKSELKKELFSYVVLRKGNRKNETDYWPRLVQPTLVRSKHAVCRMCTSEGKLEEVIFSTSKHGRILYLDTKVAYNFLLEYTSMRTEPRFCRLLRHVYLTSLPDVKMYFRMNDIHVGDWIPFRCAKGSKWGDLLPLKVEGVKKESEE